MVQAQTSTTNVSTVSQEVIEKVADVEDVDPLELTPPLYDVIDPDALDQIFASTSTAGQMDGHLTFAYSGYKVTVTGDGSVSVQ